MYSEINEKMEILRQGIARLKKIDSMTTQLESELGSLREKEKELRAILEEENLDVEKLENKSIASVFYSIVGSLDKHIANEQREALAAKLIHDQALRDKEDVEYRLSNLSSERRKYTDYQAEFGQLLERKKEMLMRENAKVAENILAIMEKIGALKIRMKETGEAISAGNKVIDSLDSVLRSLSRAESWGTWDMFGGGLLTDLEKHSNIDDARYKIDKTQQLIRSFHTELADVQISTNFKINIDGFSKFADFFFDGLFADINMQGMINNSQNSVQQVKDQVASVIDRLKNMNSSDSTRIDELAAEITTIIAKA